MIIESSFLKLPELLSGSYFSRETFEATIVHLFSTAVLIELSAKNIPHQIQYVVTEKPYPLNKKIGMNARADIFIDLTTAFHGSIDLSDYGIRDLNWLEVKAFLSTIRRGSKPPSTANIGRIVRDILRVCVLPEELQGKIRQNGRYLLLVFSGDPFRSLSFRTRTADRLWLKQLLTEGKSEISLELDKEPKSVKEKIGPGFLESLNIILNLKLRTMSFAPDNELKPASFFGFLIRISGFSISIQGDSIMFDEDPEDYWDKERIEKLRLIRQRIVERM